jgi:hypothetical protein
MPRHRSKLIPSSQVLAKMQAALTEQEEIEKKFANDHEQLVLARKAWAVKHANVLPDIERFKTFLKKSSADSQGGGRTGRRERGPYRGR